VTEEIEINYS